MSGFGKQRANVVWFDLAHGCSLRSRAQFILGKDIFCKWAVGPARMLAGHSKRASQRCFHSREPAYLRGKNVLLTNLFCEPCMVNQLLSCTTQAQEDEEASGA